MYTVILELPSLIFKSSGHSGMNHYLIRSAAPFVKSDERESLDTTHTRPALYLKEQYVRKMVRFNAFCDLMVHLPSAPY